MKNFSSCFAAGVLAVSAVVGLSTSAGALDPSIPGQQKSAETALVFEVTKEGVPDSQPSSYRALSHTSFSAVAPARVVCRFHQRVDWTHISSTSAQRAVQSHGNWGNDNCNYGLARVKTQMFLW